ncbi:pilus assembly protein [Hydrogenophaga sp. YM1]|uniref:pilus assembly protein n=1 Tax=Hydrogenophaga sp. YM1 TaxID=2806262 RepID=UPI0019590B83|nr:pilus assembly protein [Hydrogenophaga sp. YM1]QRR34260.1 pilus assembly protein [Hydrogenophaga sp. YM1]
MTSMLVPRLRAAVKAAAIHFGLSMLLAAGAALLVWGIWYPHPFDQLSGGRQLFILVVVVDVICGPALTLIVFDRSKPRAELIKDLSIIGLLQCAALLYGLSTVYEARPLFLVHDVERFRVVAKPDYLGVDVTSQINGLPEALHPRLFSGPVLVGAHPPQDPAARQAILVEALRGGRDFAQRPEYYVPYDDAYALAVTRRARPLKVFVDRFPDAAGEVEAVLVRAKVPVVDAMYLPVVHRQDWIAILDGQGQLLGFVPGDGFAVH